MSSMSMTFNLVAAGVCLVVALSTGPIRGMEWVYYTVLAFVPVNIGLALLNYYYARRRRRQLYVVRTPLAEATEALLRARSDSGVDEALAQLNTLLEESETEIRVGKDRPPHVRLD